MDIRANRISIGKYQSDISVIYGHIQNLANSLFEDFQKWIREITARISEVRSKINALQNLYELAASKEREFSKKAAMYLEEAKRIYDAGYWVEHRDDDGRVIGRTYEYDTVAYDNAQRNAQIYAEKAEQARALMTKIGNVLAYLSKVLNVLQTCLSQISTLRDRYQATAEEVRNTSYQNQKLLSNVVNVLNQYISSSPFTPPNGTFRFSGGSGGGVPSNPISEPRINGSPLSEGSGGSGGMNPGPSSSQSGAPPHCTDGVLINNLGGGMDANDESIEEFNQHSKSDLEKVGLNPALVGYTQDGIKPFSYADINRELKRVDDKELSWLDKRHREEALRRADEISSLISGTKLEKGTILYSGRSMSDILAALGCPDALDLPIDELRNRITNQSFVDAGFISTSVQKSVAEKFANKRNGTIIEIVADKGTQALHLGEISAWGHNASDNNEYEVLLQKGTRFNILSVDQHGREQYYMKVKIIDQEKHQNKTQNMVHPSPMAEENRKM
ncbi:MAG TPA: hypothetical protein O0X25_04030 [Methanocorpusculum sp.]|nr:hypothetical protein [Methanocorpusculum sp.]HJJ57395.1 hypothetical protein [Methanocorpusculum sp.]